MRWNPSLLILCVCSVVSFANSNDTSAQNPAFTPGRGPANEVIRFTGKLKGVQRGVLLVTREDGTEAMVQPPQQLSSFTFVATAKPAFLGRGSMVRFSGTFQANGISTAAVNKVEVFVAPPRGQKLAGHDRQKFTPGIYPADRKANPNAPVAKYNVVGGLIGILPNGVMTVQTGKRPLQVQLAQDVSFQLVYNNLSLAQPGDAVSVVGFYEPPDETKVRADRISITTERIYGEPPAPAEKRSRKSRRTEGKPDAKDVGENPADEKPEQEND